MCTLSSRDFGILYSAENSSPDAAIVYPCRVTAHLYQAQKFKRGQGYFSVFFFLPLADLIIPTNRRSKAGKKKKACPAVPPYLRSYRTVPHHRYHHAPPQIPLRPLSSSTTTQPPNPIPPSTPRAPGCPRPKPFNTFQVSSSSCFTSSIELSPFPCHHPATSSITPRCLPRRAPPPRR